MISTTYLIYNMKDKLTTPYRFSSLELEKMNWLKESIFKPNKYSFSPDRFPEVYYQDFHEFQFDKFELGKEDGNPDYLGVYCFDLDQNSDSSSLAFSKLSKEGVIILFKDRIESYSSINPALTEEAIRFVVLMHELGHWLAHWAEFSGKRWTKGFHLPNRKTEDALAQLICFWCCEGNKLHEDGLFELSPKDSNRLIDTSKIYGGYESLKIFSYSSILKKLNGLRQYWIIKDDKMIEFLNSDYTDIDSWLETQKIENGHPLYLDLVEKELAESYLGCGILDNDDYVVFYEKIELGEEYLYKAIKMGVIP